MLKNPFYHGIIGKSNAIFGTLFNEITIEREAENGHIQSIRVPISYAPREKFLARLRGDPNLEKNVAITLPRMSYMLMNMDYDQNRQLNPKGKITEHLSSNEKKTVFQPVPFNLEYQLSIITKTDEDASKILEQIIPFFTPSFTLTANLLDEMPEQSFDITIIRNSVSREDAYEGDFQTRRVLIYTLDFTMKTWFFGPVQPRKLIKFAKANLYPNMNGEEGRQITARPGLTKDGEPTTYLPSEVKQAYATATITNGEVTDISITENIGYSEATISIDPPPPGGTQAIAKPIILNDSIIGIDIISRGSGYISPPNVYISPPDLATISFHDINETDNWEYIVRVEDL